MQMWVNAREALFCFFKILWSREAVFAVCLSPFFSPSPQVSLSVYAANTQPDQPQLNPYLYPCLPFHPSRADEVLRLQCPFREDKQIPAGDA